MNIDLQSIARSYRMIPDECEELKKVMREFYEVNKNLVSTNFMIQVAWNHARRIVFGR